MIDTMPMLIMAIPYYLLMYELIQWHVRHTIKIITLRK